MKKVLIAGGTGLIGKEIIDLLNPAEYQIHILSRSKRENKGNIKYFQWNLKEGTIEKGALEVDHIINLTGAGIADKRWTQARKELLISSRVEAAQLIHKQLQSLGLRPESYISASAIGFYGDSGDRIMTEKDDPIGKGFLSECTIAWEEAAQKLSTQVDRLVINRIGIVLAREGGAFQKMMLPFKGGLASYFGSGKMHYSWIHIKDIARLFILFMEDSSTTGIYNGTAPDVVTNKEMIQIIKDKKGGFSVLNSVPSFVLRFAMGEMADVVLTSNLVSSSKTLATGFEYTYPSLDEAVADLLG